MKTSQSRWSRVWPLIAVVAIAWTVVQLWRASTRAGAPRPRRTTPTGGSGFSSSTAATSTAGRRSSRSTTSARTSTTRSASRTACSRCATTSGREFDGEFGHLFYKEPFSYYRLAAEYRFVGEQVPGGPAWAMRNNGLMLHSPHPETMLKDQDFPISIEVQLLGGLEQRQAADDRQSLHARDRTS